MYRRSALILCIMFVLGGQSFLCADVTGIFTPGGGTELVRMEMDYSKAQVFGARINGQAGLAVKFEGSKGLHYYAHTKAASEMMKLKVDPNSACCEFEPAVFPEWKIFTDPLLGNKFEVYSGDFTVFIPIKPVDDVLSASCAVDVTISGVVCTSTVCIPMKPKTLNVNVDLTKSDTWKEITFKKAPQQTADGYSKGNRPVAIALAIAFLAGLLLNVMPCIWPILPLIVMRIVEQGQKSKGRSVAMGLAFCLGILLFFAGLGILNIILRTFYDTTLSWGDPLREPSIVIGLFFILVFMAMFMFGVFSIGLPSSVAGRSSSGKGFAGSVGMGFLAAILSTPCSFAILTGAFVWAQLQPLALGTLGIMVIGLGMAAPYAILTSMPALLHKLPRAGHWMELLKQAIGFAVLIIAVKMLKAIPRSIQIDTLYFTVVLCFGIWMWGSWVGFATKFSKKIIVRTIAVVLVALAAAFFFWPDPIHWTSYDAQEIKAAQKENKPVLIKFTADWCTNCEIVDKVVYRNKSVADLIKKKDVLAVKADTTDLESPATIDLKNVYNEPGNVPVSILLIPGQSEPIKFHNILFTSELKKALEAIPPK